VTVTSAPSSASAGTTDPRPNRSLRVRRLVAAVLAGLLLLVGGIALGRVTAPVETTPGTTSAEAGFARDMQTHHDQAVEMSLIIYAKTRDDAVRTLAYDIAVGQAKQSGQMRGWLTAWRLPATSPEPVMTWMTRPTLDGMDEHSSMGGSSTASPAAMPMTPGGPMPGYATDEQIDALEAATGTDADRLFLTLMTTHHQGGIEMADALLARSNDEIVTSLATGIVTSQQSDVDYMAELLARY
jgi:uncharacterized protein (DUF305 family)